MRSKETAPPINERRVHRLSTRSNRCVPEAKSWKIFWSAAPLLLLSADRSINTTMKTLMTFSCRISRAAPVFLYSLRSPSLQTTNAFSSSSGDVLSDVFLQCQTRAGPLVHSPTKSNQNVEMEKTAKMALTGRTHNRSKLVQETRQAFEWAASDTKAAQRGCYDGPMQTAAVEPLTLRF